MTASHAPDSFVSRFLLENLDIRGVVVQLHNAWQAMQADRGYGPVVRRLLGEMAAVTTLIGANLKQSGRLTFQVRGNGPVPLLVLDCDARLHLRGMAQGSADLAESSIASLLGDGKLVLTLQTDIAPQPYQSIVPLQGETLAQIFEHFLAQSEQQPTRLWLVATETAAAGLFLQKLPGADDKDADGWERVQHLAATLKPTELTELAAESLLGRLFAEEDVRLYPASTVSYDCPRNQAKVDAMLRSLGQAEVDAIVAEHGEVVIKDDICNHVYRYSAADIAHLFSNKAEEPAPSNPKLH